MCSSLKNEVPYLLTLITLKYHWVKAHQYQETNTIKKVINAEMTFDPNNFSRIVLNNTFGILSLIPSYGWITADVRQTL